ncbi:MAG TPA: cytochrome P450 [Labilithrix sp.]|jgi:cytochrome P450
MTPHLPTVPGPEPIRGLGSVPHIVRWILDPIGGATRLFERYGPVAQIVRGSARLVHPRGRAVVVATGADVNKEILTDHERYHMYALSGPLYPEDADLARAEGSRFGRARRDRLVPVRRTLTGLFHVNTGEHRRHRRLLMPAFHKTRIDAYRDDMVAIVDDLLGEYRAGEMRDVLDDMTELTLRIATKTLFGEDAGEKGIELSRMMQRWLTTMFNPAMLMRLDLAPWPYRRWLSLTRAIDERTVAIVRAKQARVARGDVGADMLSMLVAARDEDGSALDEDELVGHTGVIFAAGHETSTNALGWTLMLLTQHPDVACALHEELDSVLHGEAPTVEQLAKLPLLDAVVKESMRVLPPVPLHPRLVAAETELAGHRLTPGTELMLSIFHMHHDPAVFEEPDRFRPERWSRIKPSVYEYNPFSAGPRMCIGASFASMEIKIVLAMLLQRFRVEMPPHAKIDRRVMITMAPKNGLPMRIRPADRAWRAGPRDVRGNIRELVALP